MFKVCEKKSEDLKETLGARGHVEPGEWYRHKRRINTEEKAKVVAAAWGTELIQFLAALANLHQDDMKKSIYTSSMVFSFKNSMLNL